MLFRRFVLKFWNFWPPFFFSGIKILKRSDDLRQITAKLKLRFWNANYVGTQYGGSIFSLADPFYMIMLINNLGRGYRVLDKKATIHYLRPGITDLFVEFILTEMDLDAIRNTLLQQNKMDWIRKIEIRDQGGQLIAVVEKTISIKKIIA